MDTKDNNNPKALKVTEDTHTKVKELAAGNRLTIDLMILAMLYLWEYSEIERKKEMVEMATGGVV